MRPALTAIALLLCLLCPLAGAARAADTFVPLERRFTPAQWQSAGLDLLSPAQLAALNALLREDAAGARDAALAEAVADARAQAREEARSAWQATRAADDAQQMRDAERFIGRIEGPIRTRVRGTLAGWAPGDTIALENGQQWTVLKGSQRLRAPLASPEVTLVPGVAGRWFLEVDPDLPKARVYRVD